MHLVMIERLLLILLLLLLQLFNGLFSRTTWVSLHQKGKPFWILLRQEMMGWQWHQLHHMQIIYTSLQTDKHASTSPLSFYRLDALPAAQPTASKHWTSLKACVFLSNGAYDLSINLTLFGDWSLETCAICRKNSLAEEVGIHRVKWHHNNLWPVISMLWGSMAYCVKLSDEDLSCFSNKIKSVGLRKCPYYDYLPNKA